MTVAGGQPDLQRESLPDAAYAAAIAGFGSMTPQRLQRLLRGRQASAVFGDLLATRPRLVPRMMRTEQSPGHGGLRAAQIIDAWQRAAQATDPAQLWSDLVASGTAVLRRGDPGYPSRLTDDRLAPEVLFVHGSIAQLDRPCVAVVGTRRATHYGTDVAARLGRELSGAGVVVVSGLAAGIDTAAHEGALAPEAPTPPVAIVGGGVDVVYPAKSARVWERVRVAGGIVSEAPPGAPPEPWRFPLRNRLIAAVSLVLVVVESHEAGGALHTVAAADERGIQVLAVPGSVNSPASRGTNSLIADGCGVARDVDDVLSALELACAASGLTAAQRLGLGDRSAAAQQPCNGAGVKVELAADERAMYDALEDVSAPFEVLCQRSGVALSAGAVILEHLAAKGLARRAGAAWERCAAPRPR